MGDKYSVRSENETLNGSYYRCVSRGTSVRAVRTDWNPLLRDELAKPYYTQLKEFVRGERERHRVFPPEPEVFTALHETPHAATKVVILGQDPYHGAGQAHGLCFSVRHGVRPPPSLQNIFKELRDDLGTAVPAHGNLTAWARRGVLLLNTTLTVREGQAGSHQGKGWETFTDRIISIVNDKPDPVVFVLWGSHARRKKSLLTNARHSVIESAHPSPLSAHNGFLGSRPFSRINEALEQSGSTAIDWSLDGE